MNNVTFLLDESLEICGIQMEMENYHSWDAQAQARRREQARLLHLVEG